MNLVKTQIPGSGYAGLLLSFYFNLFGDNRSCVFECDSFGRRVRRCGTDKIFILPQQNRVQRFHEADRIGAAEVAQALAVQLGQALLAVLAV